MGVLYIEQKFWNHGMEEFVHQNNIAYCVEDNNWDMKAIKKGDFYVARGAWCCGFYYMIIIRIENDKRDIHRLVHKVKYTNISCLLPLDRICGISDMPPFDPSRFEDVKPRVPIQEEGMTRGAAVADN